MENKIKKIPDKKLDFLKRKNINMFLSIDGKRSIIEIYKKDDTPKAYCHIRDWLESFKNEGLIKKGDNRFKNERIYVLTPKGEILRDYLLAIKNELILTNKW